MYLKCFFLLKPLFEKVNIIVTCQIIWSRVYAQGIQDNVQRIICFDILYIQLIKDFSLLPLKLKTRSETDEYKKK